MQIWQHLDQSGAIHLIFRWELKDQPTLLDCPGVLAATFSEEICTASEDRAAKAKECPRHVCARLLFHAKLSNDAMYDTEFLGQAAGLPFLEISRNMLKLGCSERLSNNSSLSNQNRASIMLAWL